jgi:hypothetical protein
LAAYIDVVFLNKANAAYGKLVSTGKDEAIETAKKAFVKILKTVLWILDQVMNKQVRHMINFVRRKPNIL